jgi:hypothetical protein
MKKIIINIILSSVALVLLHSCGKQVVSRTANAPALNPTNADANAGSWKTILLAAPGEVPVAAPIATNTPEYRAQINEIKSFQQNLSESDREKIQYWGAGAVLRWNEIMRELVALHNLAPVNNPDGSYPIPDATNPLAYPLFPFANPPYAARAYAYVSAAQYDALVAAYHYKQVYNRKAPFTVDGSLQTWLPQSTLPSYPSEDAVVAGAAVEMLKLLFPGDQAYIQAKAEEHKRVRIMAGANVRSDIEAGEALGRAVAQKFVARARTDRAGAAVGTEAVWNQLEVDCIARGEKPWISMDAPKRPPMLPLFGKTKPFLFDSATAISLRPQAPPSTNSTAFKAELEEVYQISTRLTRDQVRIVHYWADGTGTYTPPGHWNAIATDDLITKMHSEVRWARNMALLNMSLMDAAIVCWEAKYFYYNPRPSQMDPRIKTVTGLPNFPAYISGHSTFSAAAATVLGHIVPERNAAYQAMAKEASDSRLYGGIHYRSDCEQGLVTGNKIGAFAIERARTDGAE